MHVKRLYQIGAALICFSLYGAPAQTQQVPDDPSRAEVLRGEYGRYRANNDLLYYHLDVRVDPDKKFISGKNAIRFKMLKDDTRIQLDLAANLNVDKIVFDNGTLQYERELHAVFIDFPETLKAGRVYSIDFFYSGFPRETGRFGGFVFQKDASGHDWVFSSCEGPGAMVWWPNKDQWRDEVDDMDISVSIPSSLVDVSNGRFVKKTDLGDGYTRWDWHVSYPINNYDVAVNIGNYVHFTDQFREMSLDFYALPENLEKAKKQFSQVTGMLEAFTHYFGEYPFKRDGYKLVEVPYAGMEHQTVVAYGNRFANGYLERDWTGVGISLKFDFIIIHESAHEWFGNSVSAADASDMWIHEGWATYMECLYVEYWFGHDEALKYTNGLKPKVQNKAPIITERGLHREPAQDQYFKGALFLNTLRSVMDDDKRWFKLIHDAYQHFKYRNIMTEDMVRFFNEQSGMNLTPIFNQYLRRAAVPVLDLKFDEAQKTVSYRWNAAEEGFNMPVSVGQKDAWQIIRPSAEWKTMKTSLSPAEFEVATDLYYVNVEKR